MSDSRTKEQIERRVKALRRDLDRDEEDFRKSKAEIAKELLEMARNNGHEEDARADMEDAGLLEKPRLLRMTAVVDFYAGSDWSPDELLAQINGDFGVKHDGINFIIPGEVAEAEVSEVSEV